MVGAYGHLRPAAYSEQPTAKKAEHLLLNDLHRTAVTLLSEAGISVPQICAVTGDSLHSATCIADKYLAMPPALPRAAILAFQNSLATQFCKPAPGGRSNQPETGRITIW